MSNVCIYLILLFDNFRVKLILNHVISYIHTYKERKDKYSRERKTSEASKLKIPSSMIKFKNRKTINQIWRRSPYYGWRYNMFFKHRPTTPSFASHIYKKSLTIFHNLNCKKQVLNISNGKYLKLCW